MSDQFTNEPMLDMYIFETSQLIEQLEQSILSSEKESCFTPAAINEIFRIMHTIKGSSAIMMFHNISTLAHTMEDMFYFLREEKPRQVDCSSLSDFVLDGVDFIKVEVEKIKNGDEPDGDAAILTENLNLFLTNLKKENGIANSGKKEKDISKKSQQYYISQERVPPTEYKYKFMARVYFEEGCEMENIRAYTILHNLKDYTEEFYTVPEDVIDADDSTERIRQEGFFIYFKTDHTYDQMNEFFQQTIFLKSLELVPLETEEEYEEHKIQKQDTLRDSFVRTVSANYSGEAGKETNKVSHSSAVQNIISVSVAKLDKLMDLVGEMVIAEAMVIQNPDLRGLVLDNFQKAAGQLNKITSELQDTVMSIRMVPLAPTFQKMHRIVRDMCKQLNKEVNLKIIGEETEVDKNIIEHISDPLMHLVRNSLDHGIEAAEERRQAGKEKSGTIILEAKNSGSDVLIIVQDDGKGLDREKILKKAKENNLLYKKEEDMTEQEIFNMILAPGFSTKESISEFSGRGVGMDVVNKNIQTIGGTLSVNSVSGEGMTITLAIPLTLAIIDGMNIKVGKSCYTIPTISIKESLRPDERDIIIDPGGNEMLMIRGQCFPILRLHESYRVETAVTELKEGIIIVVEQDGRTICIFADELLGQQQVVVKSLPVYIQKKRRIKGLAGCTLLGDGSISLILDVAGLVNF
ncbi:chemotaxis protein CheA [Kineothrix sedimenti]|uniref:Chemotaxis protein CheA n=1 Tax=Kineothrix sedimenti TaxID=3123317 RepID=A0ABZ3EXE9_9FIRM